MLKLTFLGTGASFGIPVLTCSCPTCTSTAPKDRRLRSSVLLEWKEHRILIDCGPDLRQQCLREQITHLDEVWITHLHADHVGGLDDLRPFCFGNRSLTLRGLATTLDGLQRTHAYAFQHEKHPSGVSHPVLVPTPIAESFEFGGVTISPIRVEHGPFPCIGFRIGNLAYLTDVSFIPESSYPLLEGLDVLILSALREEPHPTHFNFAQSLQVVKRVRPSRAWFTHFAHGHTHAELEQMFPSGVAPAFDGLVVETVLP